MDFLLLLQIFPVETWEYVIIKLLNYPDDLLSLSGSSPFFHNLIDSHRTCFLLEKVLALVVPKVWNNEGLQGLSLKDILKCRAVCTKWNTCVNKLIPQQFQYFGEGSSVERSKTVRDAFKSLVENHVTVNENHYDNEYDDEDEPLQNLGQAFLQYFENIPLDIQSKNRTPLICGNLALELRSAKEDDNNYQDYLYHLRGISTMLLKFGSYVKNFKLEVDGKFFENTTVLREWFLHMSNVKELIIRNINLRLTPNELNLYEYRQSNPFPKMEYLETLEVYCMPVLVFNKLIRQNNHVSSLTLKYFSLNVRADYDFFSFSLPNLRSLKIECKTDELVERLGCTQVQWRLETLALSFRNYRFNRCADLFQVIENKFSNTLVSYDFDVFGDNEEGEGMIGNYGKIGALNLPKLRNINISVRNGELMDLDFLLPMKDNLEELSVYCKLGYKSRLRISQVKGFLVKFSGFERRMLESNIWKLFSKLKEIKLEGYSGFDQRPFQYLYSREEWMKSEYFNFG